jgi:hypothetical protein
MYGIPVPSRAGFTDTEEGAPGYVAFDCGYSGAAKAKRVNASRTEFRWTKHRNTPVLFHQRLAHYNEITRFVIW